MVKIYLYERCGTCKKAMKWLSENDVGFDARDIVEAPPSKTALKKMWRRSGLPIQKMFNTSGQSYRQGGFKERLKNMSDDEALTALADDGKLIKRPLVDAGEVVLVGFKEEAYQDAFRDR